MRSPRAWWLPTLELTLRLLHCPAQAGDGAIPSSGDGLEKRLRFRQPPRVERVENFAAALFVHDQARAFEHAQVLDDRLPRHARSVGEHGSGERLAAAELLQHRQPRALAEREEDAGRRLISP